jgi:hypothetical protein
MSLNGDGFDASAGASMKGAGWSVEEVAELGPAFVREAGKFWRPTLFNSFMLDHVLILPQDSRQLRPKSMLSPNSRH